jgi:hypothetical protein
MPRKARVQLPGAVCHLIDRDDRREVIFREDGDREALLVAAKPKGAHASKGWLCGLRTTADEICRDSRTDPYSSSVAGGNSRRFPHAQLPFRTDGTHRFVGSHGHGIQSEKGFAQEDIRVANGSGGKGWPFVASLGLAADQGRRVIIYVPTGGGHGLYFHSVDGRNFYTGD